MAERELLPEGKCGNVIMSYEDRPHNFDAWDINHYYTEKAWEIGDAAEMTIEEEGPIRRYHPHRASLSGFCCHPVHQLLP